MNIFLKILEKLNRKRIVMDRTNNEPYLERYYLFLKDREKFPFNIFLHKFLKSDPDDVHDHPWPYATLILKGGYYEWTPTFDNNGKIMHETCHWRGPGHFRMCKANTFHRIELKSDVECWTLFMPGKQQRNWGFIIKDQWVPHQTYLEEKQRQIV